MNKEIEIPEGYEARIEGGKIILEPKESKEEREYVRTIKSLISDFLRGKDEIDRGYYQKIYDWLDGRLVEQKPVEWSENDEMHLNNAILAAEREWGAGSFTVKFLKSLYLKFHWKPSEKQMEALSFMKEYFKDVPSANKEYICVVSLYDDLEKLM